MIVGVTGHQRLADESDWRRIATAMRAALRAIPKPLVGISLLAVGADQLFADLILDLGGKLRVIVPFPAYAETFQHAAERQRYHVFLDQASTVEVLPMAATAEESYLTAGRRVVDLCDHLIAVWDGKPARGSGGTAHIVEYAHHVRRDLLHIPTRAR